MSEFTANDAAVEKTGIPSTELAEEDLMRELAQLHKTRHEAFLHAPTQALQQHSQRTTELELEYLHRHPERQIDQRRLHQPNGQRSES